MKNTTALLSLTLIAVVGVLAGVGWHQTRVLLRDLRQGELVPIAGLLKEDQQLLAALQAEAAKDKESGILGSYLAAIRADGVAKHADTKQRLDRLAENNAGILALIDMYKSHAKTAELSAETSKFQRYAIAWRDRWNSVMELFMAGGNYPVAEVPFPKEFLVAVESEIDATK